MGTKSSHPSHPSEDHILAEKDAEKDGGQAKAPAWAPGRWEERL